jgi:hypothetical protein
MRFLSRVFSLVVLAIVAQSQAFSAGAFPPVTAPTGDASFTASPNAATLTIPVGTKVILALTGPVWARTAHIGDPIYGISAFPVSIDNTMAIPPGTYVEGQIDALTRPTRKTNRAEFQMHFTKMVFANGYTVELPVAPASAPPSGPASDVDPLVKEEVPVVNAAVTAAVHVDVYFTSDVLLDNGSQIEIDFQSPVALDAARVAAAAPQSRAPQLTWTSATRCRPTPGDPGTPGTPDTVIPGTPSTTIPGGPGMPDITIPGTPATVIPGTPGTPGSPGISCPGPPSVVSESSDVHKESFKIAKAGARLGGQTLPKGSYDATWTGPGPDAQVAIVQKGRTLATVSAHVATLLDPAKQSRVDTSSDAAPVVLSIQFKGKAFALTFDPPPSQTSQASARSVDPEQ